jgi:ADP-ribose pyrophosphatase YjhB (NUDIX family)
MFESLYTLPLSRRWRQQTYPVASVLALIQRRVAADQETEPHYLLIQRTKAPYVGKWGLVGGRWEFGETLEGAITREVREETGLEAVFVALRGLVSERIAPLNPSDIGAHYLLFVCELAAPDGHAVEQSEGPVAWFSFSMLDDLEARDEIITSDYRFLQQFGGPGRPLPLWDADVIAGEDEASTGQLVRFEIQGRGA